MKKKYIAILSVALALLMVGCGAKKIAESDIIGGADEPTTIKLDSAKDSEEKITPLTDDEALAAIKNYCYETNPDLQDMEGNDDYTFYFNVESSDDNQIVVAFRSYTMAIVRYYVDRNTGDTYVTEFVPGITDEEEKTGETLNARLYLADEDTKQ